LKSLGKIQQKYFRDRFEIEPIGVYRNDAKNLEEGVISKKDFKNMPMVL